MAVDFVVSWVQNGGTFVFSDPQDLETFDDSGGLTYAIPVADAPGTNGEYAEDSYVRARDVTLTGRIVGPDPTTVRGYFDTLAAALLEGTAGKLYRSSDRYLKARVALFREAEKDEGFNTRAWVAGFRCSDPFYWDDAAQAAQNLPTVTGGTLALTPGGSANALPVVTLVVPAGGVGKTITLATDGVLNPLSCQITPSVAGTYVLDSAAGTVTVGGADKTADLTGDLLRLSPGAITITVTLSAAGILTSGTVQWTRRWRSG